MSESSVLIHAKWQTESQSFPFPLSATVHDLSNHISFLFDLSPTTLKFIGLTKGKLPDPSTTLSSLSLKPEVKLLVIGAKNTEIRELQQIDQHYHQQQQLDRLREEERHREQSRRAVMEQQYQAEQQLIREEQQQQRQQQQQDHHRLEYQQYLQRERERAERELKEEQNAHASVSLSLSCLTSAEADTKQKLILPPSALQQIIDSKVSFPLTFEVKAAQRQSRDSQIEEEPEEVKEDSDSAMTDGEDPPSSSCYYGVADFNSPDPSVVLAPHSLLTALKIEEGSMVELNTVTLKKATHITLTPLPSTHPAPSSSSASSVLHRSLFYSLSEPERAALLEFHLRQYQMLQRGQIISIAYRRGAEPLRFDVKDLQPDEVVSIIDADVVTDVEMLDKGGEGPVGEQDADSKQSTTINLNDSVEGTVKANEYVHYSASLDDPNSLYIITLQSLSGDADLYITLPSTSSATLSPSASYYDYRSVEVGNDQVKLSSADSQWRTGITHIAVHAYQQDSKFKLTIDKTNEPSTSLPSCSSPSSSSTSPAPTDSVPCPNCHKLIPRKTLPMHEVQCKRNNTGCPQCGTVVATRYLAKHMDLNHELHCCPLCSVTLAYPELNRHLHLSCPYRLVDCSYCPLMISAVDRGEHQAECGLLRSSCKECGELLQRKVIRRHMRIAHGRDEKTITWKDFFQ